MQGRVRTEDGGVGVQCLFVSHGLEVVNKMGECRHQ